MIDMKEAYLKVLGHNQKTLEEKTQLGRPSWVPASVQDEDVSGFMGAAANAHKSGKDTFEIGNKKFKITMGKKTVDNITKEDVVVTCEKCDKVHEGSCDSSTYDTKDKGDVKERTDKSANSTIMVVKPGKDEKGRAHPVIRVPKNKQKEYLSKGYVLAEDVHSELITTLSENGFDDDEIASIIKKLEEKTEPQMMGDNLSDGELDFVAIHEIEVIDMTPDKPDFDKDIEQAKHLATTPINQKKIVDYPNSGKPEVAVKSQSVAPKTK